MSETKEYSIPELIEGLDIIISACVTTKKKQVIGNQILSLLIDIKGVLKQLVQQPQPVEELVEDILKIGVELSRHTETYDPNFVIGKAENKAKAEIRTLLQSHRPSVTREEIYELLRELDERYGINCVNSVTFEIGELLKSKGIPVKGEK